MQAPYDAWTKSSHHSLATCNDCHTPHNLIGKYAVKANDGFWHSFYFTSGRNPDTIEISTNGTPDLDSVRRFEDLGVKRVMFGPPAWERDELERALEKMGNEIIARV